MAFATIKSIGFLEMLRRQLLIMLACLTTLMLATAISSVLLMKSVLRDLEHINTISMIGIDTTSRLDEAASRIEADLFNLKQAGRIDKSALLNASRFMRDQVDMLQSYYETERKGENRLPRLDLALNDLDNRINRLIQGFPSVETESIDQAIVSASLLRHEILNHADFSLEHMSMEQHDVTQRFRWMAISLAIIFVALINASIFLLIRAASLILKPVDRLIEASKHLAREEYSYRVEVEKRGEFRALAQGFNALAEQLETNEQRKIETLHQVARTLNHELNNAIAIIQLQLRMVAKSPSYNQNGSKQLEMIHETLQRMSETVNSLTKVRRVVLTDYMEGVKMLDLKLSTQPATPPEFESDPPHSVGTP
jgi:nitrate/nitrite-specific signal transduction histidine kinase